MFAMNGSFMCCMPWGSGEFSEIHRYNKVLWRDLIAVLKLDLSTHNVHNLETICVTVGSGGNVRDFWYIRISLVRAFLEGWLGSPVPMVLVAKTLNSYSTQGLKSMTVADSCFPPSSSGTERHHTNNLSSKPCKICHWKLAKLMMCYLLSFHMWCLKRYQPLPNQLLFYLFNKLHNCTTYTQTVRWNQPTGGNSLPPKREGRSSLDGVAEDGAVVVHPGSPGQRGSGLCHLSHVTVHRGVWVT